MRIIQQGTMKAREDGTFTCKGFIIDCEGYTLDLDTFLKLVKEAKPCN